MTSQALKKFNKLYDETYDDISRYVVINCSNIDDVSDILQNIYMDVYKKIDIINDKGYVFGIAKNKVKRYYRFNYKAKIISLFESHDDMVMIDNIPSNINLEKSMLIKYDTERVWNYLKKKQAIISKVIYLYYYMEYSIKEISKCLNITESNVKNYLYRTIKELNTYFESEGK